MRHSKKSQYTEISNRVIYILMSPLTKEIFVGHCREDLLKTVFQDHIYGERYQTQDFVKELKDQNLHPCLFILEKITCTKVEAFGYVVAWTKIFVEHGYQNLNQGNVRTYINNLLDKNLSLYMERKDTEIGKNLICENCLVSNYNRKKCCLMKGETNGKSK